jgi:hypothetical protein
LRRWRGGKALAAGALSLALGAAVLGWFLKPNAPPQPPIRAEVTIMGDRPLGTSGNAIALSPNGEWLAYKVGHLTDGSSRIYLRNLHDGRHLLVPGTEGSSNPFFSPDEHAIGIRHQQRNQEESRFPRGLR